MSSVISSPCTDGIVTLVDRNVINLQNPVTMLWAFLRITVDVSDKGQGACLHSYVPIYWDLMLFNGSKYMEPRNRLDSVVQFTNS